jgi:hypothetical protein
LRAIPEILSDFHFSPGFLTFYTQDAVNICHRIDSSYSTGLAAATQTRVRLSRMTVLDWLLDWDPAIRWQVLRDLVRASAKIIAEERARTVTDGLGG